MINIAIIDNQISNLKSVCNSLKFLGTKFFVTNKNKDLKKASHIILPGNGSFDQFMKSLIKINMIDEIVKNTLIYKKPILGICSGFQALFNSSEEGKQKGIGLLKGRIVRLKNLDKSKFKIPNIGFSKIEINKKEGIFNNIEKNDAFYFMHSYGLIKFNELNINYAKTKHNINFIAAVQKNNICGFQFHPEKSQISGIKILSNFLTLS